MVAGAILVVLAAGLAFVVWRYVALHQGYRQRDEKVLEIISPLEKKLTEKREIQGDEVRHRGKAAGEAVALPDAEAF